MLCFDAHCKYTQIPTRRIESVISVDDHYEVFVTQVEMKTEGHKEFYVSTFNQLVC